MQWDWEVVKGILVVFGLPIAVGLLLVWAAAKLIGHLRPIKPKGEEPRKKTFLEEALDTEEERRASVPNYGWNDLQTDLHDGKVTFNEIWDKCGGRLPRKPSREASTGVSGQDGGSGVEGAQGVSGMPKEGPPDEEPHQGASLKKAEEPPQGVNLKRLIGACPSKWKEIEPELPIWVKCCACSKTWEYGYPRVCGTCGGKGYLIGRET